MATKNAPAKVIFIKKKGKGHGHHGGAWKVAYADFVTAMMALFMVLWLVSQTDESTRSTLSHYFRTGVFSGSGHVIGDGMPNLSDGPTPGGGSPRMSEAERLEEARDAVDTALAALSGGGAGGTFEATVTEGGLLVRVSDQSDGLAFGLSSASITPELESFLVAIAPILGGLENDLQIHGHTDARPFPAGSGHDNWELSFLRADSARRVLETHGVRPGQIVGVLAHADSEPLVADDPLDPRNRRLAILAVRRETPAEEPGATLFDEEPADDAVAAPDPTDELAEEPAEGDEHTTTEGDEHTTAGDDEHTTAGDDEHDAGDAHAHAEEHDAAPTSHDTHAHGDTP